MSDQLRLAVDVGGTFTDVVLLKPSGSALWKKILSSPPEFNLAVKRGIGAAISENDLQPSQVSEYIHGATVATNAIITRSGAATGLITTNGFRDVLEFRRMRMPRLYDMNFVKPPPLVPRHLRREVLERLGPKGEEIVSLDEDGARSEIARLLREGIQSFAICYLHSYASGLHEERTRELVQEQDAKVHVSISSEVLPESKEYERTSTTVINAYVQPVVSHYFQAMQADLGELRLDVPIMVMQSNGGLMAVESACLFPIHIVESGPAAGVTGAYHLARRMGISDAMTLDMGGTTAKAAIIEEGEISRSPEYEVGGEFSMGHRLAKGGGYLLRVPSIDIAEVGAGGGSIAWIDAGGALKIGPRSAGAAPGPACYGLGGTEPTITDANVHLGLTNPQYLAGGTLRVHPQLAVQVIEECLASPLGRTITETAWGIRQVANSSLIRALRAVSTERGRDPRRCVLFAFGGMGPVHALDLASELGIAKVIVPPLPGLFSAVGLLFAEAEHHLIRTYYATASTLDVTRMNKVSSELDREMVALLEREGYSSESRHLSFAADLRYRGQDHALTIPIAVVGSDPTVGVQLVEDFHHEHEKTYGYRSESEEVLVVAIRCMGRGISRTPRVPERLHVVGGKLRVPATNRRCFFGPELGWVQTNVVERTDLIDRPLTGPGLIEEDNSLTVVLPGWAASLDEWSNIVLTPTAEAESL